MTQIATVLGVATVYIGLWTLIPNGIRRNFRQEKFFTYFATCSHW